MPDSFEPTVISNSLPFIRLSNLIIGNNYQLISNMLYVLICWFNVCMSMY